MCPLATAGARGYADYQRVGNYDTGILWSVPGTLGTASVFSPVLDVSRFAFLGGRVGATTGQCAVTIVWWSDAAATVAVGAQTFQLDHNIQNLMQLRLPNLGPFVTFTVNNIAGAAYVFFARILATNRTHPLQVMPDGPVIMDQSNVAVGANANVPLFPTDYYAGPLSVWVGQTVAQASFITLRYLNIDGTYHNGTQVAVNALTQSYNFIVPPGAWRFDLGNGPAAQNMSAVVIHTLTGAT